jgi:hypothetical protein
MGKVQQTGKMRHEDGTIGYPNHKSFYRGLHPDLYVHAR